MFARIVSMRLKPNTTAEFTQTIEKRILPILRKQKGFRDEITFIAPGGLEAVGISLWDSREQADAYNNGSYGEVLKELNKTRRGHTSTQNLRCRQFDAAQHRRSSSSVIVTRGGPVQAHSLRQKRYTFFPSSIGYACCFVDAAASA